ncbi:MAG: hypothetical protein CMJ31_13240 [Phycisphaerae bacterium]|nr:hypothetical protein [Phycisphaerae bacterium]
MTTENQHDHDADRGHRAEDAVRSLATWTGDAPGLWRRAIDQAPDAPASESPASLPFASRPIVKWIGGGLVAALVLITFIGLFSQSVSSPRSAAVSVDAQPSETAVPPTRSPRNRGTGTTSFPEPSQGPRSVHFGEPGSSPSNIVARLDDDGGQMDFPAEMLALGVRSVVRTATLRLETDDVRDVFVRAQSLINPAYNEYIAASEFKDDEAGLRADLTLCVAATRLDGVLNELREMAHVVDENIDADDVTAQVVDTDARLHNERRLEEELLQLLAEREDADLDDVLRVRKELAAVRERVERLTAQRDKLANLIRLSTVVLVIREPAEEAAPPKVPSVWSTVSDRLTDAWTDGLHALLDTITFLIRVAVGGLIWLALLATAITLTYRHHRRANPRPLPEAL